MATRWIYNNYVTEKQFGHMGLHAVRSVEECDKIVFSLLIVMTA